ncbi:MAG: (Fe-S)-binding protein [Candidatus Parvarchaeota archaeon]|nr:(Fe-S)-binding protein [Candidatus Jingweiarchaeum tengchongense]MCW1298655.1 (Fe-S)-binding protein [Candidatus Jingweiarchaeum tengchongense]MCW1300497.1 (Fe-S)-binding protein [Candidatus Jingweiarchaeum tengchongense]MCW1304688.1 (Fe-S)-binding protein [Candidatus Jingweiarchaeum tengchongense]MCW1305877.1 (Fe-S)-binding protein [Candidatus Jingweiarchaeum tengchongense]
MGIEKCSRCGFCKVNCPIFRVMLSETLSPRGKMILLKKEIMDEVFYICALCKSCEENCPAEIKISEEIKKIREKLIKNKKETEANKKMIENIRKFGNPFGKIEEGKIPRELYCC